MIRPLVIFAGLAALSACGTAVGPVEQRVFQPFPGQGQYVRPAYLNAQPIPRVPPVDSCRSQLYQGLVGQHEGTIFVTALPGRKRVIKPAQVEGFGYDQRDFLFDRLPFVEVQEYLAGQTLYAPSVSTVDRFNLGPAIEERITIELDQDGYIETVGCG